MRGVWGATKHIGDIFKMLSELSQAPLEIRNKDNFRITCDTLRRALRLDGKDFNHVESMTQSQMMTLVTVIQNVNRKQSNQPMLKRCDDNVELREQADLCFSGDGHVSQDGDRETVADLGGDGLDFGTGSDTGRDGGCQEHVAAVEVGTVVNEDNALDHDAADVTICSTVEAFIELGDAAFETQIIAYSQKRGIIINAYQPNMDWTREERDCYQFLIATPFLGVTGDADVLDNVVLENGMPDRSKYGRDLGLLITLMTFACLLCELLKGNCVDIDFQFVMDFLGFYLNSKGLHELAKVIIKERRTRLLDLPWKTS
ncbi:hypothetical protein SASPL_137996 [Salvia splendens]|uniref:Uncharacterized protein n=1 Tax=Salvia splendens TaxID=180675 RepID=A0A8X8WUE1_SALSN|nr:hypothetical protein SASPL_137996 [Salvia splendens]